MQHELGWEVVNCYDEWDAGVSKQGRDGKRVVVLVWRLRPALQRLNPDLPAVELFREFFLVALSLAEVSREIDKHRRPSSEVLFAMEPDRLCNRLVINELLFELKTPA